MGLVCLVEWRKEKKGGGGFIVTGVPGGVQCRDKGGEWSQTTSHDGQRHDGKRHDGRQHGRCSVGRAVKASWGPHQGGTRGPEGVCRGGSKSLKGMVYKALLAFACSAAFLQ